MPEAERRNRTETAQRMENLQNFVQFALFDQIEKKSAKAKHRDFPRRRRRFVLLFETFAVDLVQTIQRQTNFAAQLIDGKRTILRLAHRTT